MFDTDPDTGLPHGWSIDLHGTGDTVRIGLTENRSGGHVVPGRRVERISDIADPALRTRARAMVRDLRDRADAVIDAFTATAPVHALVHRLRAEIAGVDVAIHFQPRDLSVHTTLTATRAGAGTLLRLITDWLTDTGRTDDRIDEHVHCHLDPATLSLTLELDQLEAESFFAWYRDHRDPLTLDAQAQTAVAELLDLHRRRRDPRLDAPLAVLERAHAIATAPTWCELPEHLRASMVDGYDSDAVCDILGQIHQSTGIRVVCLWAYHDDFGYGGDSDFRVVGDSGRFYFLGGELWAWLNHPAADAPAHPGAPTSWIASPDLEHTSDSLAASDGSHNYALENRDTSATKQPSPDPLEIELAQAHDLFREARARISKVSPALVERYLRRYAPAVAAVECDWRTGVLTPTALLDAGGTPIETAGPDYRIWLEGISDWISVITDTHAAGLTRTAQGTFLITFESPDTTGNAGDVAVPTAAVPVPFEELVAAVLAQEPAHTLTGHGHRYLIGATAGDEGIFLITDEHGHLADFTAEIYEACVEEGIRQHLRPVYRVYARYNLFATTGVQWTQLTGTRPPTS